MTKPKYAVLVGNNHTSYEFVSIGPKGYIKKVIQFIEIKPNLFNLGFGDWDEKSKDVDDNNRSNNGDRDKVLTTVASAVLDFIQYYPNAHIFAEGSTPARTRLYQIGISNHLSEIGSRFEIQGFINDEWETFAPNKNYEAFLVHRK